MPTKRRRRAQPLRERLSPALALMFTDGPAALHGRADLEGYAPAYFFSTEAERAALWREHGPTLLETWMAQHPGSRPWGWWKWNAPGPRRLVRGEELLAPVVEPGDGDWIWKQSFGVPATRQIRPIGFIGLPA